MSPNPSTAALIEQGHQQLDKEDYAAALETFQQAAAEAPRNHEVLYGLGLACYHLERYEQAVEYLNQALEVKPNYILALARRGLVYKKLKKTQQAEADFQQAISLTAEDADGWRGRGFALDELGRYEDAVAAYDKAIEIKPDDYYAWLNRGYVLGNLERYEDAIDCYDKAIQIKPDDYYSWVNMGAILCKKLQQNENAIAFFDKAIEIKPDDYDAWLYRGIALDNLEKYEDAVTSFEKAIEIKPDDYDAWFDYGNVLLSLERYEDAIAAYNKAIEIKPDNYSALINRGSALFHLERNQDAVGSFEKAIEIKPDNYIAWLNRGSALGSLARYKNAIASFDQALSLTNYQEWKAWRNRGIALLNSRDYKAAITTWDNGTKALKPSNPDYEEGCGELHRHKGETLSEYATKESEPFTNWLAAKDSYEKALTFLTFEKFPQLNLQVLQELLQVCSTLGDESAFQKYIEAAAQSLEKMVAECDTQGKKITLEHRYAAFNQLRVDIKLQSKDANKEIAALELAEKRKNTCLGWLQENWDYQPPKITYQDMQKLLNPKTAAIFWHISPNAITTFIVKHNQPTIVLSPQPSKKKKKQNLFSFNFFGNSQHSEELKAYLEQLQSFQSWINEWKQDYQEYCQEDYTAINRKIAPWRKKMKGLLESLSSILEINRITEQLAGIEQLILIPHRELHLLPLDYLFPQRFNITYLPSFQIGLKLLAQAPVIKKPVSQILNVTDDYLVFNAIESIILNTIYPSCNKLEVETVTQKSLTTALQKNSGYFHFSGHGYHIPDNPRDSALALAESDKLTLGDIFDNQQLDLSQYELICLSACETGITSTYSLVDEYVGLTSGFLAKGATYVLSTLWNVDERSTALFMIQFYQLMQQGNTPTIALKQAKKWLRQLTYKQLAEWYFDLSEKLQETQCKEYLKTEVSIIENDKAKITSFEQIYAHPYYWAGFILTGKVE